MNVHEALGPDTGDGFEQPEMFDGAYDGAMAGYAPEEEDKPRHECGIVGIYAPGQPVAAMTYQALEILQHRGQSAAGISVVTDEENMTVIKGNGFVPVALPYEDVLSLDEEHGSPLTVGHVRWSTTPSDSPEAAHPYVGEVTSFAKNGHVEGLRRVADKYGVKIDHCVSDSHELATIIDTVTAECGDVVKALHEVLPDLEGAYCILVSDGKRLVVARDSWAFHPVSIGELPQGGYMVASETVALDDAGVPEDMQYDLGQGEIAIIDEEGVSLEWIDRFEPTRECMMEYIYFAKENSRVNGVDVLEARRNMGRLLAEASPLDVDIIVGTPDSGIPSAEGYAEVSGIPYVEAIERNPDIQRTFIMRKAERERMLERKFMIDPDAVKGRRVGVFDDSLVRGSTQKVVVRQLRAAGATEVHVVSASPRNVNPCYMGIDTGDPNTLIARGKTDAQVAHELRADSVTYSTPEIMDEAVNMAAKSGRQKLGRLCTACVTGEYPVEVPGTEPKRTDLGMPSLFRVVELQRAS